MFAFRLSPFILLSLLYLSCARQEPPSGGPEDTIPPQVLDHLPPSLTTKVPPDIELRILFSEPMDRKSVEESIFISPPLSWKASWRDQILTLSPSVTLSSNRTYVVTLGTGCRDIHHNPLSQAYTLAFSTGDSIDRGSISGITFFQGQPIEGASIWAYLYDRNSTPLSATSDYITQSGVGGHFRFRYLTSGDYRVFALLDKNRDGEWDPSSEPLALPPGEAAVTAGRNSVDGLYLSLALRDTTRPNLVSLQPMDYEKVRLVFDHQMDSTQIFTPFNFSLSFTHGGLPIKGVYPDYKRLDKIYILTSRQEEGREYTLRMKEICDKWGNPLNPSSAVAKFYGSSFPDTVLPGLRGIYPPDGARAIPLDVRVELFFSEPMSQRSVEEAFGLLGLEGDTISGTFSWLFLNLCYYTPEENLPDKSSFNIILEGDRIKDLAGNRLSDSTFSFVFSTLNTDTLGSISGRIALTDETLKGMFLLSCKGVDGPTNYVKIIEEPGPYSLDGVITGRYGLSAYLDRNFNRRFDQGRLSPFSPAEFFTIYPDTVRVRARWETEGIDMDLGLKR